MNGSKRYVVQKHSLNRHGGKTKEVATSSRFDLSSDEDFINSLPLIKQSENVHLLPRYTASKFKHNLNLY